MTNTTTRTNYTPDSSTMERNHENPIQTGIPIPCSLMSTKVCPHPECDGYKRMCGRWKIHSSK